MSTGRNRPAGTDRRAAELLHEAARRARKDFLTFAQYCIQKASRYIVARHHRVMAEKLQRFADPESDLRRLMLFVPPQHGKSELASRQLPPWILGHHPHTRIIGGSYAEDHAIEKSRDAKKVIKSREYRRVFPETKIPDKHVRTDEREATKNTASHWEVVGHRGSYRAKGKGQGVSGNPADFILIDDPLNRKQARSQSERDDVYNWYKTGLVSRLSKHGKVLLIQTRWHQDDLAGRLLKESREVEEADDWEVVKFPAICQDPSAPDEWRDVGEPLWPWHKDLDELRAIKLTIPEWWSALYQQEPTPEGGAIIQNEWCSRRWETPAEIAPGTWYQSWDLRNNGKGDDSSFAVGQLWVQPDDKPGCLALVDQVRGRWDINETLDVFDDHQDPSLHPKWAQAKQVFVEDEADGRTLIPMRRDQVAGLQGIDPGNESKGERLNRSAPYWRAGNVILADAPWVDATFVPEVTSVPGGTHDDQADAASQVINEVLGPDEDDEDEESQEYWESL